MQSGEVVRELARASPDEKRTEQKKERRHQNGEAIVVCSYPVHSITNHKIGGRRAVGAKRDTTARVPPGSFWNNHSLERKPNEFDVGRGLDVFVADDEIERGIWFRRGRGRRRCRGAFDFGRLRCRLRARRSLVLLVSHVQRANDEKLLVRARDLIDHTARRARRRSKTHIERAAFDQFRPGRAIGRATGARRSGSRRGRQPRVPPAAVRV